MLRSLRSDIDIDLWNKKEYDRSQLKENINDKKSFIIENKGIYLIVYKGTLISVTDSDNLELVKPQDVNEKFEDSDSFNIRIPNIPELVKVIGLESLNYTEIESFYTEEMPIDKIDQKLSENSFDGYISISENTISGSHYIMYHNGERSCITDKKSEYLTNEESYDRALSYAGVYTLYKSDYEYNRKLDDIISLSDIDYVDNSNDSEVSEIEKDIDGLSNDNNDANEQVLDSLDSTSNYSDTEYTDSENNDQNQVDSSYNAVEELDTEKDGGGQNTTDDDNLDEIEKSEPDISETSELKDTDRDVLDVIEETSEHIYNINDKVQTNNKKILDLCDDLDKIKQKLDELKSDISNKQNITNRGNNTNFKENKTYKNKSPESAIRNTKIKIQYPVNTRTLKQASENPEKSVSDLINKLHINTKPTFDKHNCLINGIEYDEFIEETTVYNFTFWMINEFYPDLLEKESPNIDGVRDMISRIEGVYNSANLKAEDIKSEVYDSIIYERDGTPTGVLDVYDEEKTVSLNDIKETVDDIRPISNRMKNTMNILILAEGTYDPGIRSDVGKLVSEGGILRNENRDALIKNSEGGEIHICLFEKYQDSYNVIYPDHKSI